VLAVAVKDKSPALEPLLPALLASLHPVRDASVSVSRSALTVRARACVCVCI
jgi:hypothetical protein